MLSGVVLWLSVWLSGGLLAVWWSLVWLCVSGWLCGSSGGSGAVCCLWVFSGALVWVWCAVCLVSVSGGVSLGAVVWSSGLVSGLVFWSH